MLNFLDKVFKGVHALERTMTMLTNNAFYATYVDYLSFIKDI